MAVRLLWLWYVTSPGSGANAPPLTTHPKKGALLEGIQVTVKFDGLCLDRHPGPVTCVPCLP